MYVFDDLLQLETLLKTEQENIKIKQAFERLQDLKDQYRQKRQLEVQYCLALYPQKPAYIIAVSLEQRRIQLIWQSYLKSTKKQDYSTYRLNHLIQLIIQLFSQEDPPLDEPRFNDNLEQYIVTNDQESINVDSLVIDDCILRGVIYKLVSEPYFSDEPKPSGIWESTQKCDEPIEQRPFLPQHIFTEAEPTPPLDYVPNTPFTQTSYIDHERTRMMKELEEIQPKWISMFTIHLEFIKQIDGSWLLEGTTNANKQFLSLEDQLIKIKRTLKNLDANQDLMDLVQNKLNSLDQFKIKQKQIFQ